MAAKAGDIYAAYRLTYDILTDEKRLLKIKALKAKYPNAVYVGVHAEERKGKNKIPEALAQFIGNLTGQAVDTEIIQKVKAGRTGQGEMYRLAYRPKFDGYRHVTFACIALAFLTVLSSQSMDKKNFQDYDPSGSSLESFKKAAKSARLSKGDLRKIVSHWFNVIAGTAKKTSEHIINWIEWRRLHQSVAMWYHYQASA